MSLMNLDVFFFATLYKYIYKNIFPNFAIDFIHCNKGNNNFYLVQVICLYYVAVCYFCFDNIFCILVVHLAGQFRILRYRFTKLCNLEHETSEVTLTKHAYEFYEKLKMYIRHHQLLINYCKRLETVYTMIIFGQVLVFSVLICLFAYQGLLVAAPIARRSIFIFLLIGSMALLFMFTYGCDGVIEHSDEVAEGAYSALWTIMPMNKSGRMLRNDLIMVIERSRRVCCLTANGFFPISLKTYTKIMSTAMSYFTLLRNQKVVMHTTVYSDISVRLSQFLLKVVGISMATNDAEERLKKVAMAYTIGFHVFSLYMNISDIYHSWGDFNHCAFVMSSLLSVSLPFFKIMVLYILRTEYDKIILYVEQNFWDLKYKDNDRMLFTECRKLCNLWAVAAFTLIQTSLSFYVVTPLYSNYGKNKSERILPFQMWLDIPMSMTPYYEILFTIQVLALEQVGLTYLCSDNYLCIVNVHVMYQFRMLQYKLLNLWKAIAEQKDKIDYTEKCYEALKECIRRHQSLIKFCNSLENVYTLPILAHVVVFSLLMCIDAYEIFLADVPATTRLIFVFTVIGSFMHIVFFTYSCHGLIEESTKVCFATYSGWWTTLPMTETGKMIRKDVNIMMMKSFRPCCLSAGGFFPVSLETSTALLSSTFSYFTLIRESSLRIEGN
ncbi:uncharacterized protein LOC122529743 [Frieseomelitta varia]|uniref:uncharacterized protein LOC122529743 n=1 Tax=Frieseomelitta varia TaxID=561572 RepID=UPI001CB69E71|nr:uncharacterized protein LOC122529743 [Frieseomelitta varia]